MKSKGEKIDYNHYSLSWKQWVQYSGEAIFLCWLINYLFYQSIVVFLFLLPVSVWYIQQRKKQQIKLRKQRIHYQFKDALSALQVGIAAGYSLDNAVKETRKDLEKIYGKTAEMTREFSYMEIQLGHNIPLEELLYDLGVRSRVEDIMNFSDILVQSKRMGGNMKEILQKCIASMEERIQVKKEINTILASKKMEQKLMSVIPLGIIMYMRLTSADFLDVLYHTGVGICVMTVCLCIYLFAFIWGVRLTDIEV